MNSLSIISAAQRKFKDVRIGSTDVRVCCPFCHTKGMMKDWKYKLYISLEQGKNVYHCFRCDAAGPIYSLLPSLMTVDLPEFIFGTQEEPKKPKVIGEELPPNMQKVENLDRLHPASVYLKKRDIDSVPDSTYYVPDYIQRVQGSSFSQGPRLIFGVFMEGKYRGFQARTISNHPIRYLSSFGFEKSKALYNWDSVKKSHQLVVVEGIFDVLKVGLAQGVALFGKRPSETQIHLILKEHFDRIIILLDPEAKRETTFFASKLAKYHGSVWTAKIPWPDPGAAPARELRHLLSMPVQLWRTTGLQKVF